MKKLFEIIMYKLGYEPIHPRILPTDHVFIRQTRIKPILLKWEIFIDHSHPRFIPVENVRHLISSKLIDVIAPFIEITSVNDMDGQFPGKTYTGLLTVLPPNEYGTLNS